MNIELVKLGIIGIQMLMANPVLKGQSAVPVGEAAKLLGVLTVLIEEGEEAHEDLKAFVAEIETLVAAGSHPREENWISFTARQKSAHDRIQAVKAALMEETETLETEPPETEPPVDPPVDPPVAPPGQAETQVEVVDTQVVVGSTYENRDNLSKSFFDNISKYEGTKIGRQELYGEVPDPEEEK